MKVGWISLALFLLASCGGGMSGEYGGKDCLMRLNFTSGGRVYVETMGVKQVGKYEVDGANVIVTDPEGKQIVFTKTAEGLVAQLGILGKMTCKKL